MYREIIKKYYAEDPPDPPDGSLDGPPDDPSELCDGASELPEEAHGHVDSQIYSLPWQAQSQQLSPIGLNK